MNTPSTPPPPSAPQLPEGGPRTDGDGGDGNKVRPRSGVVVPLQPRWHGRLAARLIWMLVWLLSKTIRWTVEDRAGCFGTGPSQPVIFAVWHNRLALSLAIHARLRARQTPRRRAAALISASRDGGLLARIVELGGLLPVRGSSSRRGAAALRELVQAARAGHDLAITPDGPRGPCYSLQPGIIAVAQLTGHPIIPVGYWLGWKTALRSWDRFQIPLPFSRCHLIVEKPILIPPDATEADRARLGQAVAGKLREITRD